MKKKKIILIIVLFIFLSFSLYGCKSSSVNSFSSAKDENYIQDFNNILVVFRPGSIKFTKKVEETLVKNLEENNLNAIASHEVFPLTREYSNQEAKQMLQEAIKKHNVDSSLFISITDQNIDTETVEFNTSNNNNYNSNSAAASFLNGFMEGMDGSQYQNLTLKIGVKLININKGGVAWRAQGEGGKSHFSGEEDLIELFKKASKELVEKLKTDNII